MRERLLDLLAGGRGRESVRIGGIRGELRVLTAWEILCARREAARLVRDDREQALCSNACLLALAFRRRGRPVYPSGEALLHALSAEQIALLARRYARLRRQEVPGPGELEQLKKVWSTRRMSA